MKAFSFLPAFGYLLLLIFILHKVDLFPHIIDLPIYAGDYQKAANNTEVIVGKPIHKGWYPTWGTLILVLGIFLLYWEILKSTQTSNLVTFDHALSTIVFIAYFGLWLTQPWAGNSLFLTLTLMALLDVIAGFTITISVANRDINLGGGS